MKRPVIKPVLMVWCTFLILLTAVIGFAYIAVQQNYRQSANDPQIQLAEDAASSLVQKYVPSAVMPSGTAPVDLAMSLSPWISVYDASGASLESSGVLYGAPPALPKSVFDITTWKENKTYHVPAGIETRFTWQPRPGVRQAVVLVEFNSPNGKNFVAVGRSLRETEIREDTLMHMAALAWGMGAFISFFVLIFFYSFATGCGEGSSRIS